MSALEVEQIGNVLVATMNRPERRNALNGELMGLLGKTFQDAETDDGVGALVLAAAGEKAFCAGMDLREFAEGGGAGTGGPGIEVFTRRIYPKPIIAAVNGPAVAGGFELMLACDLVVTADTATFGIPEVKRGLVAAGGGILKLPTRVPLAVALELGLTGDLIDARRAAELGLVNRVVPADQVLATALELAAAISANGPLAVRVTKQLMLDVAEGLDDTLQAHVDAGIGPVFVSEDAIEGATAFAEKRTPNWKGR